MIDESKLKHYKLSNYKWTVKIINEYGYDPSWEARNEENTMSIKGGKSDNVNNVKINWESFANDNRIKYFVYIK